MVVLPFLSPCFLKDPISAVLLRCLIFLFLQLQAHSQQSEARLQNESILEAQASQSQHYAQ